MYTVKLDYFFKIWIQHALKPYGYYILYIKNFILKYELASKAFIYSLFYSLHALFFYLILKPQPHGSCLLKNLQFWPENSIVLCEWKHASWKHLSFVVQYISLNSFLTPFFSPLTSPFNHHSGFELVLQRIIPLYNYLFDTQQSFT